MENKSYSTIYRIMHWAIAFTLLFILFTIFLRLTWLNRETVANIIKANLPADKTLSDKEIMTIGQMKYSSPFKKELSTKVKFQFWVYIIFYICVAASLFTGLMIEFGPESLKDQMEEIHVLSIYYLITFLILHIGGVLLAEFTSDKGIVSRIVSGKKNN